MVGRRLRLDPKTSRVYKPYQKRPLDETRTYETALVDFSKSSPRDPDNPTAEKLQKWKEEGKWNGVPASDNHDILEDNTAEPVGRSLDNDAGFRDHAWVVRWKLNLGDPKAAAMARKIEAAEREGKPLGVSLSHDDLHGPQDIGITDDPARPGTMITVCSNGPDGKETSQTYLTTYPARIVVVCSKDDKPADATAASPAVAQEQKSPGAPGPHGQQDAKTLPAQSPEQPQRAPETVGSPGAPRHDADRREIDQAIGAAASQMIEQAIVRGMLSFVTGNPSAAVYGTSQSAVVPQTHQPPGPMSAPQAQQSTQGSVLPPPPPAAHGQAPGQMAQPNPSVPQQGNPLVDQAARDAIRQQLGGNPSATATGQQPPPSQPGQAPTQGATGSDAAQQQQPSHPVQQQQQQPPLQPVQQQPPPVQPVQQQQPQSTSTGQAAPPPQPQQGTAPSGAAVQMQQPNPTATGAAQSNPPLPQQAAQPNPAPVAPAPAGHESQAPKVTDLERMMIEAGYRQQVSTADANTAMLLEIGMKDALSGHDSWKTKFISIAKAKLDAPAQQQQQQPMQQQQPQQQAQSQPAAGYPQMQQPYQPQQQQQPVPQAGMQSYPAGGAAQQYQPQAMVPYQQQQQQPQQQRQNPQYQQYQQGMPQLAPWGSMQSPMNALMSPPPPPQGHMVTAASNGSGGSWPPIMSPYGGVSSDMHRHAEDAFASLRGGGRNVVVCSFSKEPAVGFEATVDYVMHPDQGKLAVFPGKWGRENCRYVVEPIMHLAEMTRRRLAGEGKVAMVVACSNPPETCMQGVEVWGSMSMAPPDRFEWMMIQNGIRTLHEGIKRGGTYEITDLDPRGRAVDQSQRFGKRQATMGGARPLR
jgi:hypothetical protein